MDNQTVGRECIGKNTKAYTYIKFALPQLLFDCDIILITDTHDDLATIFKK